MMKALVYHGPGRKAWEDAADPDIADPDIMASRPIVVGVDGSEQALHAVGWAAREAAWRKAPLRIISVSAMPSRMRPYSATPATVADNLRKMSARALSTALARAQEVAPGLLADADLVTGAPVQALTASGSGASMLVLGARGAGGFSAMVLGSVSRYVAAHAPCPVVVAPEDSGAVQAEIVVGVGDPAQAADSLGFAFDEASMRGARLTAVHALQRLPWAALLDDEDPYQTEAAVMALEGADAASDPGIFAPADEAAATADLAEVIDGWRDKYPEVAVSQQVIRGHPGRVLARWSTRADLVVIGRHGDPHRARLGSIQHPLLSHAHGAIGIVPSHI
jgi:nucleotide-binding universal stress UspA family protein